MSYERPLGKDLSPQNLSPEDRKNSIVIYRLVKDYGESTTGPDNIKKLELREDDLEVDITVMGGQNEYYMWIGMYIPEEGDIVGDVIDFGEGKIPPVVDLYASGSEVLKQLRKIREQLEREFASQDEPVAVPA
jgi:hypothetical protein